MYDILVRLVCLIHNGVRMSVFGVKRGSSCVHVCESLGVKEWMCVCVRVCVSYGVGRGGVAINADVLYGLCAQNFEVDSEHKRERVCVCA